MIIISLGSNVTSRWGDADATIRKAMTELERFGIRLLRRSRLYKTTPYGPAAQPDFTNAAALIDTSLPPPVLLVVLKKIETRAGRRPSLRWGPRALDIDILDYNRRILNWAKGPTQAFKCKKLRLILPHPGITNRPFVLRPMMDIVPDWHHPVYGLTALQLYKRLSSARMGRILNVFD